MNNTFQIRRQIRARAFELACIPNWTPEQRAEFDACMDAHDALITEVRQERRAVWAVRDAAYASRD